MAEPRAIGSSTTLLGVPAPVGAPLPPTLTPAQNTLLGMAPPAAPNAEDKTASWERAAERALSGGISPDVPTPLEVPVSGAGVPRSASAKNGTPDSKPSGVAKPYVPKQDANMPPVVVDAAAMKAGQAAAQEEQARRKRNRRTANAITIPGNVRVVPRGPGQTPAIEPIDSDIAAALKPSRAPWIIGFMVLAGIAVGAALFMRTAPEAPKPPPAVLQPPKAEPQPPPPAAEPVPSAQEAPAETVSPDERGTAPTATPAASSNETAEPATSRRNSAGNRAPLQHSTTTSTTHKQTGKRSTGPSAAPSPAGAKGKATIVRETPF